VATSPKQFYLISERPNQIVDMFSVVLFYFVLLHLMLV